MKSTYCALIVASFTVAACSSNGERNVPELSYAGDTVTVNIDSPILSRLRMEKVGAEQFSSRFSTVGTVQAETGRYAEVTVPFDGRIISSNVRLGSRVHAGQTLFEMSSAEFLETSKLYFQNRRNYETAKANYERKKSLESSGIVSKRELEEAATEAENARHELECTESSIRVFGIDPSTITVGQAQKIVAPISGEVVKNTLTPGAFVKADGGEAVTVADLARVWVTVQVKERYINSLHVGEKAEVYTEADPANPIIGKVLYVGSLVDDQTRSVQVVVSCDNADRRLKHGMYVSVKVVAEPKSTILIPSTALFQGDGMTYVYICTEDPNVFLRHEVKAGVQDDGKSRVTVLGGLEEGDEIVAEGGLYLNS